ncbi:MAG: AMP-binding protein [Burkholderiales bacterium]|nr:AMP-binding protein [Burkholderiales bacterium]
MPEDMVSWPADAARRYREDGLWRGLSLYEQLAQTASHWPDATAVVDGELRRSGRELQHEVDAMAAGLHRLGLRAGDRVVFQLANGLRLVEVFFALMRLGVVPVMALPAHRRDEIVHFVRASEAVALLVPESLQGHDYRAMAREVAQACPGLRHVLVDGRPEPGQVALEVLRMPGDAPPGPVPGADRVALMLLSGGTTGVPKLIPRTHDDYLCGCLHAAQVAGFGPQAVFLAMLPMAHNYTLGAPGFVGALACGATTVVARTTHAEQVFPLIERERVTVVSAAAPVLARWLASDWPERSDLRSLQVVMCGGSRLPPEQRRRVEQRLRCTYQESYGTAEGLLNMTRLDDPEFLRHHSSGRPVCPADEIRIVDADGNELPDGQPGELQARGPYTIRGYFRAPQADARAFTADGFYRMGDLVRRVDGYLFVEGRLKELINRGGEKVSCEEVESHLVVHPAVQAVCVVAAPDEVFGERVCAFVVARPGVRLELEQLREFMRGREIARFKWPERLELVDELPISPAGKVLRRALQARLAGAADEPTTAGSD